MLASGCVWADNPTIEDLLAGVFMQFEVKTDHPALAGHFPHDPVVPGVVILDHILSALFAEWPAYQIRGIRKLKFLRPLLLDKVCQVQCSDVRDGRLRFFCLQDGERIVEGSLVVELIG